MQVKDIYIGKDHVGDVPLLKKIAAGLTTGRHFPLTSLLLPDCCLPILVGSALLKAHTFSSLTKILTTNTESVGRNAGALAICVASPTDLVKVRLQAEGKLPPGVPRRYSGAMNAYSTIFKQV